jgi:hypothetical protein
MHPTLAFHLALVDEKVAAVVAGNQWGGVTGNVLRQTLTVIRIISAMWRRFSSIPIIPTLICVG